LGFSPASLAVISLKIFKQKFAMITKDIYKNESNLCAFDGAFFTRFQTASRIRLFAVVHKSIFNPQVVHARVFENCEFSPNQVSAMIGWCMRISIEPNFLLERGAR
jgi:hypothetical protein